MTGVTDRRYIVCPVPLSDVHQVFAILDQLHQAAQPYADNRYFIERAAIIDMTANTTRIFSDTPTASEHPDDHQRTVFRVDEGPDWDDGEWNVSPDQPEPGQRQFEDRATGNGSLDRTVRIRGDQLVQTSESSSDAEPSKRAGFCLTFGIKGLLVVLVLKGSNVQK